MSDLDAGIVYNSTVGLEMAYEGIPVIVAGNTHYRGHGITFDPVDRRGYFEKIDSVDDLSVSPEMEERSRRYAHYLFVTKHIEFPFYETMSDDGVTLKPINRNNIESFTGIDQIIDQAVDEPSEVLSKR
jgi:hypothetical protein